jgi:hypothetical protein
MGCRTARPQTLQACGCRLCLRGRLGRIIRDIRRKVEAHPTLEEAFALPLGRTSWMISAFSDAGYLMPRPPISCFF